MLYSYSTDAKKVLPPRCIHVSYDLDKERKANAAAESRARSNKLRKYYARNKN